MHDAATTAATSGGAVVARWGELFVAMEAYFYVSLCDEELCQETIDVFEAFLSFLPSHVVIQVRGCRHPSAVCCPAPVCR